MSLRVRACEDRAHEPPLHSRFNPTGLPFGIDYAAPRNTAASPIPACAPSSTQRRRSNLRLHVELALGCVAVQPKCFPSDPASLRLALRVPLVRVAAEAPNSVAEGSRSVQEAGRGCSLPAVLLPMHYQCAGVVAFGGWLERPSARFTLIDRKHATARCGGPAPSCSGALLWPSSTVTPFCLEPL